MIKNENDLLGFIIMNKDQNNEIKTNYLISIANTDLVSLSELVDRLVAKKYLIFSYDILSLTDIGIRNYVSTQKRFAIWLSKLLVLTIKNAMVYIAGILSGILVAYISNMLIH